MRPGFLLGLAGGAGFGAWPGGTSSFRERLHQLEDGPLISRGQLLDELQALAEPGGLRRGSSRWPVEAQEPSAETLRAGSSAPGGWMLFVSS